MNDVEHDLRELFERKASSVGGVAPRLPEPVRKRGRRRQLGTAFVGGLTALAVVVGSVGALRAIDTGRGSAADAGRRSLGRLRGLRTHGDGRQLHDHEPERLVPREPVAVGADLAAVPGPEGLARSVQLDDDFAPWPRDADRLC